MRRSSPAYRAVALAVALLACACATSFAEEPMLAVLGLDAASRELADDVETILLEHGHCRLVDRQRLDVVFREHELSGMQSGPAARSRLGLMLRADMLILVGSVPEAEGGGARSFVCDVSTGARLSHGRWTAETAAPHALAGQALETLARFPDGVTSIVAIPDFISRDLLLRYAHLQTDLAEVLRQSLADVPGLALVELEEAKAIAAEMELAGGMIARTLRLHVEGDYRTDALAEGGPAIAIRLAISDGSRSILELESGVIALDHAGRFVGVTVRDRLREALHLPPQEGMDAETQFSQLVTRADAFARIGDFSRSAALREAALLLNPDAAPQRVRLVRDYNRACDTPVVWRRALLHVETLVRNRRVDAGQGTSLFYDTLRSLLGVRSTKAYLLLEEERQKKEFIRAVVPALVAGGADIHELAGRAVEMTLLRMDGNHLAADDLDLLAELLCGLLPEETPVVSRLLYVLRDGPRMFGQDSAQSLPVDAWLAFLERLKKSPRPLVRIYGRYGGLCDLRYRLRDASDEALAVARALAADVRTETVAALDPSKFLAVATRDEVTWLERARADAVRRPEAEKPTTQKPGEPNAPILQPDGSLLCDRVRLVPLQLRVFDERDATIKPLEGHRWQAAGGWARWESLVPAWEGVDAVFAAGALLLVDAERVARPVLVDRDMRLSHVVFDGRHLWAASGSAGGISVYDREGRRIAHVTEAQGLPTAFSSLPILALDEGKVMAAGTIGGWDGPGWIASVALRDGMPSVQVIHEAVDAVQDFWDFEEQKNPRRRFVPDWIVGHRDEDGRQWAFVSRGNLPVPLMVEVETKTVSTYPARSYHDAEGFPRKEGPEAAFLSRAGELHVAGSDRGFRSFRLDGHSRRLVPQPHPKDMDGWHSGNATAGSLAVYDGWLYYAGGAGWQRRNLATGEDDVLVHDVRMLPGYGSGRAWRLAVSRSFGLVAWTDGKLYQVVPPDVSPDIQLREVESQRR